MASVRFRPCTMCGNAVQVRTVPPAAQGAVAVDLIHCPLCDRRQCNMGSCKAQVPDGRAKRCPAGHLL